MIGGFGRRLVRLMTLLLMLALAACKIELYASVTEQEANEILALLLSHGIECAKTPGKEGMVGIQVEESKIAQAVQLLRASGLPRERFARMGEVFKKEGLISSPLEEQVRYVYALSQEIADTISQIDGVISARVHVVLPERGSVGTQSLVPSSAAVFIKYRDSYPIEPVVPQIRRLVANSIPSLDYNKVSAVLVPSAELTPGTREPFTSALGIRLDPRSVGLFWTVVGSLIALALATLGGAAAMLWLNRDKAARPREGGG